MLKRTIPILERLEGIEIWPPYANDALNQLVYDKIWLANAVTVFPRLRDKSFDLVVATEILEHLTKEEGLLLLSEFERVARKCIVISTPRKFYVSENWDDNSFQYHRSVWNAREFTRRGYKVKGWGIEFLENQSFSKVLSRAGVALQSLSLPIPRIARWILAKKEIG